MEGFALSRALATLLGALVLLLAPGCDGPGAGQGSQGAGRGASGSGGTGGTVFPGGEGGEDGGETPSACEGDADCPEDKSHCAPTGVCIECLEDGHCTDATCDEGKCLPSTCTPGEATCNGNTRLECTEAGDGWDKSLCVDSVCAGGTCTGCEPGATICQGDTIMVCRADSTGFDAQGACDAAAGLKCYGGECLTCYPGAKQCVGHVAEVCNLEGQWQTLEDCNAAGKNCTAGSCVSACAGDIKFNSNSGCDYWAVDLDNVGDAVTKPYAIVVTNLTDQTSVVTVSIKAGAGITTEEVASQEVGPGQLHVFDGLPTQNMMASGVFWTGYRVQSTAAIIAYQFNPLDNDATYSNDASLLLPSHRYGKEYIVMSQRQFGEGEAASRGAVTILASTSATKVQITTTTSTQSGDGVQAMQAGVSYEYVLDPFQVMNIKSDAEAGDLTGTIITSDKPIGVFGGHDCAFSETSEFCCCDHVEQQLFPVKTWGKEYVAAKSFSRHSEVDRWRVLASVDGTEVSFHPESVSPPVLLGRGQFFEVATAADFTISATEPVMVSQMLSSSSQIVTPHSWIPCFTDAECAQEYACSPVDLFTTLCLAPSCTPGTTGTCPSGHTCVEIDPIFGGGSCEPTGDPAMILSAPVEQFRTEYVFLSPLNYRDDYVNIVAPTSAEVTLDGLPLGGASWTSIPGTGWKVAREKVQDGVHTLNASEAVGVVAYGYDDDVSYGYTAGLNLSDL